MIEFSSQYKENILFSVDTAVKNRLAIRVNKVESILRQLEVSLYPKHLPGEAAKLGLCPFAHGITAFSQGFIESEHANDLLSDLLTLAPEVILRLASGEISLVQEKSLLPSSETRGTEIYLDSTFKQVEYDALDVSISTLCKLLGKDWAEFVSIIKFITFVKVDSWPDIPYFSGSSTDFWGAIHMSSPKSDFILAESLTHEAAHHWLNLVEEIQPLSVNPWGNPVWKSPWRSDLRPIGGVIHGVFVFSCVAVVLSNMRSMCSTNQNNADLSSRLVKIISQVQAGSEVCIQSEQLTNAGNEIVTKCLDRVDAVINEDNELLFSAKI